MTLSPETFVLGLTWYVAFLFSLTLHEAGHAWAALKLGDPTAYHGGQVTLNPLPHIRREPFGTVLVPVLTFFLSGWMMGWASAPYDPLWALRHPRRAAVMALAGPAANLLIAIAAGLFMRGGLATGLFDPADQCSASSRWWPAAPAPATGWRPLLSILFTLNLLLFVFNLIPLPPLDGSGALHPADERRHGRALPGFPGAADDRSDRAAGRLAPGGPGVPCPCTGLALRLLYPGAFVEPESRARTAPDARAGLLRDRAATRPILAGARGDRAGRRAGSPAAAAGAGADPYANPLERELGPRRGAGPLLRRFAPLPGTDHQPARAARAAGAAGLPARAAASQNRPGEYFWGDDIFWIFAGSSARRRRSSGAAVRPRVDCAGGAIIGARRQERQPLPTRRLDDAAPGAGDSGRIAAGDRAQRIPVAFEDLPERVWRAVLAAEDHRFFEHSGLDARAIARALLANVFAGKSHRRRQHHHPAVGQEPRPHAQTHARPQGLRGRARAGSRGGLRQEGHPRNLPQPRLSRPRRWSRAARRRRRRAGLLLEAREPAHRWPRRRCWPDIIQSPNRLNPLRHPEAARQRQLWVLKRLEEIGVGQGRGFARGARQTGDRCARRRSRHAARRPSAAWISEPVASEARRPQRAGARRGGRDHHRRPAAARRRGRRRGELGQAAQERETPSRRPAAGGAGRARCPGRRGAGLRRRRSGRRRRLRSRAQRQAAAGLGGQAVGAAGSLRELRCRGRRSTRPRASPTRPLTLDLPTGPWRPANTDGRFRGIVTLRTALAESLNVPFVRVARHCGFEHTAERVSAPPGCRCRTEPPPSFVLGAAEATPLELAAAFTPFAAGGELPPAARRHAHRVSRRPRARERGATRGRGSLPPPSGVPGARPDARRGRQPAPARPAAIAGPASRRQDRIHLRSARRLVRRRRRFGGRGGLGRARQQRPASALPAAPPRRPPGASSWPRRRRRPPRARSRRPATSSAWRSTPRPGGSCRARPHRSFRLLPARPHSAAQLAVLSAPCRCSNEAWLGGPAAGRAAGEHNRIRRGGSACRNAPHPHNGTVLSARGMARCSLGSGAFEGKYSFGTRFEESARHQPRGADGRGARRLFLDGALGGAGQGRPPAAQRSRPRRW